MADSRLRLALGPGGIDLPEGTRIAVVGPGAGYDLSPLGAADIEVIQPFRPDHDWFAAQGRSCRTEPQGRYGASLVVVPRAKAQARHWIAMAVAQTDGPVLIDGQKTDGIDSIYRDLRKRAEASAPISKAHGKLFWIEAGANLVDWRAEPQSGPDGFLTAPGVFSADAIDPASRLLGDALPDAMKGRVADLGGGWGYLSAQILRRSGVLSVDLVEADHVSLTCARANLHDARVRFHWADATDWTPPEPVDHVVMNPPFHSGRAGDPSIGHAFIAAAARILKPNGILWMVANRHLPYERALGAAFRDLDTDERDPKFKIVRAAKPVRKGRIA